MLAVPEMRGYLVRVPGASQAPLSDADLADVVNWILKEFNADTLPENFRQLTTAEVSEAREYPLADPLKHRIQFWKNYEN